MVTMRNLISQTNDGSGSQSGSQRRQTPSDVGRRDGAAMQVIMVSEFGGPEVLELGEADIPSHTLARCSSR